MPSEQELIELRRQKREQLLALGDAYPARTSRTHEAARAVALFEKNEREGLEESRRAITVAGFSPQVSVVKEERTSSARLHDYERIYGELRFVRLF